MHPLLAQQLRYCLMCGQLLKLPDSPGEQPRCANCERPFDPKDPGTFAVEPPAEPLKWWQSDNVPGAAWLVLFTVGSAVMGGLAPKWSGWIGGSAGADRAGAAAGALMGVILAVFVFIPWLFACIYLLLLAFERHLRDEVMVYLVAGAGLGVVCSLGYHPGLMLAGLMCGLLAGLVRQWRMNAD